MHRICATSEANKTKEKIYRTEKKQIKIKTACFFVLLYMSDESRETNRWAVGTPQGSKYARLNSEMAGVTWTFWEKERLVHLNT